MFLAEPGKIATNEEFRRVFQRTSLNDSDFTTDNFPPGAGGELKLYNALMVGFLPDLGFMAFTRPVEGMELAGERCRAAAGCSGRKHLTP